MDIDFNNLPIAVSKLFEKLDGIEKLLLEKGRPIENLSNVSEWLDLDQLCEYLPTKPKKPTVYGWINNKLIPYNKRGQRVFFNRLEIDVWMKESRKLTVKEIYNQAGAKIPIKTRG